MLAIVEDSGPEREEGEPAELSLGRIIGYDEAIRSLLNLAEPLKLSDEPAPEYAE